MEGYRGIPTIDTWNDAEKTFYQTCKEGDTVLIGWYSHLPYRITLYTIKKENGIMERYTRVSDKNSYQANWTYLYCSPPPN